MAVEVRAQVRPIPMGAYAMETEGPAGGIPVSVKERVNGRISNDVFAKFAQRERGPIVGSAEGTFQYPGVTVKRSSWEGLSEDRVAKRIAKADAYYYGREHSMPD